MKKLLPWCLLFVASPLFVTTGYAQNQVLESESHRFTEVAEGVWHVSGTGSVYTMSNALVLVGESDTLVVDSHVTPDAARALIDSLSVVTDKPIRYLVNSHYHFDHAHGNQAFPDGIEIIGHEFTRVKLNGESGNVLEENTFRSFSDGVPATVASLAERAAAESNSARKASLEESHRVQRNYMNSIAEVIPTPPNITLESKMTLFQETSKGSREIQLLHLGRAHTGGDVVIFLPEEKVVFTGDMMLPGLSYMGDGHVDEWPATLEALKQLDFEAWVPGHGPVMRTMEPISNFQRYLVDLWSETEKLKASGMSASQAAIEIDLTSHKSNFPQIQGPGADPRAIRRIYSLLDQ